MKKALSAVLAVVLVLSVCFSVPMIVSGADANDLTFELNAEGTGYIVKSCSPDANGELVIPDTYNPTEENKGDSSEPEAPVNSDAGETETTTYNVVYVCCGLEQVTLSVDKKAAAGATVTVTVASVAEGYELTAVVVKDSNDEAVNVTKVSETQYTFVMPESDVTISAECRVAPETYSVTPGIMTNGTVIVDKASAEANEEVTLTVKPDAGYKLKADTLKVTYVENEETKEVTVTDNKFVMPAANVSITAEFEAIVYEVKVNDVVDIVTLATDKKDGATVGETVTLQVVVAKDYLLRELSVVDASEKPLAITQDAEDETKYTFTMPASDVNISATYIKAELPVVAIADEAFKDCVKLTKVTLGANIATIGTNAFAGCTGITAYEVAEENTAFTVEDGVLFNEDVTELIAFPAAIEIEANEDEEVVYTIPSTVEAIAEGAFISIADIDYIFTAQDELEIAEKNTALDAEGVLHYGMTTHTEDEGTTTAATCVAKGETVYKCTECAKVMRTVELEINPEAHKLGEWRVETAPTCENTGLEVKDCTLCDAKAVTSQETSALGHSEPENWEIKENATCGTDGSMIKVCTREGCDKVLKEEVIKATGKHTPDAGEITTAPTCLEDGVKTYVCKDCGTFMKTEVVPATGHSCEEWTSATVETCETAGKYIGTCDVCDTEYTVDVPALGHTESEWVEEVKATCEVKGWHYKYCTVCDDVLVEEATDALGHEAGDWVMVTAPTCGTTGLMKKFCVNCGKDMPGENNENVVVLEATGEHVYTYETTTAPTCTEKGVKTGTCTCGATVTEEIDALGHDIEGVEFTTDTPSTCKVAGSKSKHCKTCDEKLEVTALPLAEHTADDTWTVVEGKEATCYAEGQKTGKCPVCERENVILPIEKLEHTWADAAVAVKTPITKEVQKVEDGKPVVDEDGEPVMETITYAAATCEDKGYTVIYCSVEGCGAHKADSLTEVNALGHEFNENYDTDKPGNKLPTCAEAGYKFVWCDTCSEANKENENKGYVKVDLPKEAHAWGSTAVNLKAPIVVEGETEEDTVTYTAPTCEDEGYTAIYCSACDAYKDLTKVAKLGHSVLEEKWETKSEATCTAVKVEKNTCNRCEEEVTRKVGELAECVFAETTITIHATCTTDGKVYRECTNADCEEIKIESETKAYGHVHGDNEWVVTAATCTTAGQQTKACNRVFNADGSLFVATEENPTPGEDAYTCEGVTETIDALGHKFAATFTEDVPAKCGVDGRESRHCEHKDCTEVTGSRRIPALTHTYSDDFTTDVNPTCTTKGSKSRHCTQKDCTSKIEVTEIDVIPHTYSESDWLETKEATCAEAGEKTINCTVCNTLITEEITALGHDYSETFKIDTKATCLTDGQKSRHCSRCEEKTDVTVLKATGHAFDTTVTENKPQETAATCTTDGEKYTYCTACKAFIKETITAPGHTFAEDTEFTDVVEPNCVTPGSKTGLCEVCDKTVTVTIPKAGHAYGDWVTTKKATCTEAGSKYRVCTLENCPDTENKGKEVEEIESLGGHTESGWKLGKAATCGEAGYMYKACTVCKEEIENSRTEIPATGKHTKVEEVITAPTCNEAGTKKISCSACEQVLEAEAIIPATGHKNTDWYTFVEPTCTEEGIKQSACSVCLVTTSEKIPALGHKLGDWITDEEATCTTAGSKHQECSVCDYKTDATVIAALDHDFVGNECANDCGTKLFAYEVVEDVLTITAYNGKEKVVSIPATLDSYDVKAIGEKAFMDTDVETVFIPETVTTIGAYAFANTELALVNLPESVETIGDKAFGYTVVIEEAEEDEEATEGEDAEATEPTITETKVEGFKVFGVAETAAEEYATDNSFTFVAIEDVYEVAEGMEAEDKVFVVTEPEEGEDEIDVTAIVTSEDYTVKTDASYSFGDTLKIYGTGTVITVYDGDNIVEQYKVAVRGDVNGDGVCDVIDCMLISLAESSNISLEDEYLVAGDYDGNASISEKDFQQVVGQAVGVPVVEEDEEESTEAPTETTTEAEEESTENSDVEPTEDSGEEPSENSGEEA